MSINLADVKTDITALNTLAGTDVLSTVNASVASLAKLTNLPTTTDSVNLKNISVGDLTFPMRPNAPGIDSYSKTDPTAKLINSILIPGGEAVTGLLKSGADGLLTILSDVTSQLKTISESLFSALPDITDSVGNAISSLVPVAGFDINLNPDEVVSSITSSIKSTGISTDIFGIAGGSFEDVKELIVSPMERVTGLASSIGGEFVAGITSEFAPTLPTQVGLPGLEDITARFESFNISASSSIAGIAGSVQSAALGALNDTISSVVGGF